MEMFWVFFMYLEKRKRKESCVVLFSSPFLVWVELQSVSKSVSVAGASGLDSQPFTTYIH